MRVKTLAKDFFLPSWLINTSLTNCILLTLFFALSSCGGGSSNSSNFSSFASQSSPQTSSNQSSSVASISGNNVVLSGRVSYDYVPHNSNHIGLNYSAIEVRPVRGAVVELINANGVIAATGTTDTDGNFSFNTQQNLLVKLRIKAELSQTDTNGPTWNFKVTDNTDSNALYALDGSYASTGSADSQRNLHASSGWDGNNYSGIRAAAPFAILDNVYIGLNRINAAGNTRDLNPLEFRWSVKNKAAAGDPTLGEIGTSSYDSGRNAIYILGDANNDTDEYDPHVLLHEWAHYLENNLFRSDSIGGDHSDELKLDMRVAMSEGFANAIAAMVLDNPHYADAINMSQASGFTFNVAKKARGYKGFFSEGSVGSIFYNYYTISAEKFSVILRVLDDIAYHKNEAMVSIFLFYGQLKERFAVEAPLFNNLMIEQNIFGTDEYGTNETNSGGLSAVLPVYKYLKPDNVAVNVCSSPEFGKFNKLANSQFIKLEIAQSGNYSITATKMLGADVIAKPEIYLFQRGVSVLYVGNTADNIASGSINLNVGNYVIEVYDLSNRDENNADPNTLCFDVRAVAL